MLPAVQTPTDNLYKFMAVTGLLMAVLSIWYSVERTNDLNVRIVRLNSEIERAEAERVAINQVIDALQGQVKEMDKPLAIFDLGRGSKFAALTRESEQIRVRQREFSLKAIELKGKQIEIELLKSQLAQWRQICGVGLSAGVIIAAYGFYCWYVYLQKPQDAAAQKQAK